MAFFIISAALPWIGALIAFRSAAPRTIALDALIAFKYLLLPNTV